MTIVRPITDDGLVGYDKFDQLTLCSPEGKWKSYTFIADVRSKTCAICNHGWEPTGPSMADQYRWALLEEHVHLSCFVRHLGLIDRSEVYGAICDARIRFKGLVVEPNGYWRGDDPWGKYRPWYSAELLDQPYKLLIGMRKRVWSIELIAQGGTKCGWFEAASKEFEGENVTKEFGESRILLHAWGSEKMREYIKRLVKVGDLTKPKSAHEGGFEHESRCAECNGSADESADRV
jgi:hypothetical protein